MYDLTDKEFRLFQKFIYETTGINLNDSKRLLLIGRLSKRLRARELDRFIDYYEYLQSSAERDQELIQLINAITTNKTDFFREITHFEYLKGHILPAIRARGQRNLRVWCAASSTGEEPYSLAMVIHDFFDGAPGLDIKLLATDLDTNVLELGRQGVYDPARVKDVPAYYRRKYVIPAPDGNKVRMHEALRSMISFKRLNLMQPRFPFRKGFDIIFCRNVIIYFKKEDRPLLINRFREVLREDGYLVLGHSESLLNETQGFKAVANTIYLKA